MGVIKGSQAMADTNLDAAHQLAMANVRDAWNKVRFSGYPESYALAAEAQARAAWVKKTQTPVANGSANNVLTVNETQAAGTPVANLSVNTLTNNETQAAKAAETRAEARKAAEARLPKDKAAEANAGFARDQAWRSANEANCIKAAGDRARSKAIAAKADAEAKAESEAEAKAMAEANRIKAESEAWTRASWFTKLWMWLDKNG